VDAGDDLLDVFFFLIFFQNKIIKTPTVGDALALRKVGT
jgi:hypothetical protein